MLSIFWASLVTQLVKNLPAMWETGFDPWVGKIPWRRERLLQYSGLENSVIVDFPIAQMVKNLPAMQETWVQSLGQEDPLKKEMATHSSILAWRNPWTEETGGLQSMGSQGVGSD